MLLKRWLLIAAAAACPVAAQGPAGVPTNPEGSAVGDSRRTAVVRAVEQVQPAVVSIYVTYRERVIYRYRAPFFRLFPLYHYQRGEKERTFGGSGLVVSEDGYILTNDHVVRTPQRPDRITVSIPDKETYDADYVGRDMAFDLAILKVDGVNLPVARRGDSDDILVGEWAIAIGNPFSLGGSVSAGVVSAVNRDFPNPRSEGYTYRDMIQTDAAINQGNSGGPLVNALGEVIGINSFIVTESNYDIGSIGIGFAIPINTASTFLEEVLEHGRVRRPWHGFVLQAITSRLAEYLELPTTDGALVVKVHNSSPAYDAGLERGDVLLAIDGDSVGDPDHAAQMLDGYRVDDKCSLTVLKGGTREILQLRFAERPKGRF